jgi:hypothetical protein
MMISMGTTLIYSLTAGMADVVVAIIESEYGIISQLIGIFLGGD